MTENPPKTSTSNQMRWWMIGVLVLVNLVATNFLFPFWRIYAPLYGLNKVLIGAIAFPISLCNGLMILRLLMDQRNPQKAPQIMTLTLGVALLIVGYFHHEVISDVDNNLNIYLKPREQIVEWVKTGKLKGDKNCFTRMQAFKGNPIDPDMSYCAESIPLPPNYAGLSRNGKIDLVMEGDRLELRFTHSTYNFGDGAVIIVYEEKSHQPPTWKKVAG